MQENIAEERYFNNLFSAVFAIFGASALVLAGVGIYGVIAFSVERRTQEIGLRLALGAQRGDVLRMLLRQAAIQLGLGLVIGLPMAIGVAQGLTDTLYPARPGDPSVFAMVAAGLTLVALVACLVPGQRAMDVDPNVALRYDA
jgi:putative ABC transport system permease protein